MDLVKLIAIRGYFYMEGLASGYYCLCVLLASLSTFGEIVDLGRVGGASLAASLNFRVAHL
jgi:hypothetical protein